MVYSSKDFNFIDFCHDSAKYASIMALAAPKVEEPIYLPLHYSHPLLRDSKSMEKDQFISMIHFLVKREDERAQENQELKEKLLAKGAVVNCDETWCRSISYLPYIYRDV